MHPPSGGRLNQPVERRKKMIRGLSSIGNIGRFLMCALALFLLSFQTGALAAGEVEIGFLLKTMQEQRYQTDRRLFIEAAQDLGASVKFDSSGNDELRQLQQFEEMMDSGVKVIVLQPVNTGTAGALVAMANARGIRVVGYDSMLTNGPLDVMVMQDSWAVGKLQGEAMVSWLMQKKGRIEGNIALIMGQPGDSNAQAMSSGLLEILAKNSDLRLIAQRSHVAWSPDLARETVDALLVKHNNQIDAFICNNSGLAYGVIAALEAEGLADANKVFVAGSDADLTNIRYVAKGKQSVEIWKKISPLAKKAAEIAVTLAKNPDKPIRELVTGARLIHNGFAEIPTIVTPVVRITKDNIDSTLIADGIFTRQQVYED
jgi:D-xylose transport system substrate-binding protein